MTDLDNSTEEGPRSLRFASADDVRDPESTEPKKEKVEEKKEKVEERKEFGTNVEAVVSFIANAVGLGNVWRFPYLCYKNGGGAFFVPYTLMLIIAAMPMLGLELAWGQFTSLGTVGAWNCYPLLGGVGITCQYINLMITIYYAVLTAYALFYVGVSLYSLKDINQPIWEGCNHNDSWNTEKCFTLKQLKEIHEKNLSIPKSQYNLPTSEFWYNFVSEDDGSIRDFGYPNWKIVIALFLTWAIVLGTLWSGVRTMGKSSYFFGVFPYFCIIFLVAGGIFKDGAAEGVLVYLIPKFEKVLELEVWADAGQQIFFSLTVCQGVTSTLSSFNDFHQDCLTNALIVVVVNCITSFWVGFPIFAVLGHMAHEMDTSVDDVINSGPGLAFVAYPQALSLLPGAAIWGVIFCAMVFSVGLGTLATNTECIIATVIDAFPSLRRRKREIAFRCLLILAILLLGLPMICSRGGMSLLNLDDSYSTGMNSFILGILQLVGLGYLYGMKRFGDDVAMMIGHRPNRYWTVTWRYLAPLFLVFMGTIWIVNKATEFRTEPDYALAMSWLIPAGSLVPVPLYAIYVMCKQPGGISCDSYRRLTKPNDKWGPANKQDRTGRYEQSGIPEIPEIPSQSDAAGRVDQNV